MTLAAAPPAPPAALRYDRHARTTGRPAASSRLMSTPAPDTPVTADRSLKSLLLLLATMAGTSVAHIYYNPPLLVRLRRSFPQSAPWVCRVPAVGQLGDAAGMLLLAPLGERFDRRRLI